MSTLTAEFLRYSFSLTFFLLLHIFSFRFAYFPLPVIKDFTFSFLVSPFPFLCSVWLYLLPSQFIYMFDCFSVFTPSSFFLLLTFPFFPFLFKHFLCLFLVLYFPPVFSHQLRSVFCFYNSFVRSFLTIFIFLPSFLCPFSSTICCCQMSLQGRIARYLCPRRSAYCWCSMDRTLRP